VDIADRTIQVGGAREGQSFVLKVLHPNFGKLPLLHIADPPVKNYVNYQTNEKAQHFINLQASY
jgi:hypothetical protein